MFAQKLNAFLRGLKLADQFANGKRRHEFIIEDLEISSAQVRIREKQRAAERPLVSSVEQYESAAKAIYGSEPSLSKFPRELLQTFRALSRGTNKTFQHGEIEFDGSNVIRIDDYLLSQSEKATVLPDPHHGTKSGAAFFRGTSIGTFDGVLRVIDSRGELLRATLLTTAGDREIDCVVKKDRIQEFAANFDHRVRIEGAAHYDGETPLPARVDVNSIRPVKVDADLTRWRGAFRGSAALKEDWNDE